MGDDTGIGAPRPDGVADDATTPSGGSGGMDSNGPSVGMDFDGSPVSLDYGVAGNAGSVLRQTAVSEADLDVVKINGTVDYGAHDGSAGSVAVEESVEINSGAPAPGSPVKRVKRADLRLADDVTSSGRVVDPSAREPAKAAFLVTLKTFGWWLLVPMLLIGGLAGALFGMVIYWVTTGDFGISYLATTQDGSTQTLLPEAGPTGMTISDGLMADATVWSLVFTGVSAIVFFLMKWRRRAPDAAGSLAWRTDGRLDVWWKALLGALTGAGFYVAYLLVAWGLAALGVNLTSSDTGSTVENMIMGLWHTGGARSWVDLVLLLACVCLVNPVAEELVFRGMIGRRLVDSKMLRTGDGSNGPRRWWGSLLVCLLSGLFFGVVHFTSLSMAGVLPVILTTLFGALCVWLSSIKTRSLWVSISAHVAFNSIQMVFLILSLV